MNIGLSFALLFFVTASMMSQTPEVPSPSSERTGTPTENAVTTSASTITPDLGRLQTVASQAAIQIGQLHIEKWRTSSAGRSAAQSNADSVQRNLTSALPGLIAAVRVAPEDVNAGFKLYRNLNALYDVFGTLTEATRVFGQKSDCEVLAQQLQVLSSTRRQLGEWLEQLTASTQIQLKQMRLQIKAQQEQLAAAAAAQPKQVVVAQTDPPKKAAPKKKSVAKKPATPGSGSNANSPSSNSNGQTGASTTAPKS